MRRLLWILPLIALIFLVGLRVVQKKSDAAGAPGGGGRGGAGKPVTVELAPATSREILKTVEAVGTATAPQVVRLSPPTSGRITYLEAREGDTVRAGDVLVRIDPSQVEGTVLQMQAGVSEAEARLAQAQATVGSSDIGIESAVRSQRAAVTSAQAELTQAKRTQEALVSAARSAVTQQEAAARSAQADVASAAAQEKAAQATLKNAQTRLRRTQNLFDQGYIAAQDVDDAQAVVEQAQGQVGVAVESANAARARVAQANAQRAAAESQVTVVQRQAQAQVATAEANLRSANAALETALANRAQKPANRKNLDALEASVRAAQGQLGQATAARANTELKSPIDGTITQRTADPGTLAQPGTAVLTVSYVQQMFVEAAFPVEQSSVVVPGVEAFVTFDALPGKTFSGRIADVNRAADPQSRQFTVRVRLDNKQGLIRPGMFGRVQVVIQKVSAPVTVPLDAVKESPKGASVTVVDADGTAHIRSVKLGNRDQECVAILDGIAQGEKVVILSARALKEGQKVSASDPNDTKGAGRQKAGKEAS